MSHSIERLDRVAYALQPAWHGLGKVFDRVMTTHDVLEETSIGDYEVKQSRGWCPYDPETGRVLDFAEHVQIEEATTRIAWRPTSAVFNFRHDLPANHVDALLSPTGVGEGYTVVQNRELCEIADAVIGETGAQYESAGTLKNGALVWLLARCPSDSDVKGDVVRRYILIYSSHDGSRAITVAATHVRVVCWNTLSAVLDAESANRIELRHSSGVKERIADAVRACQLTRDAFDAEQSVYNSFAGHAVSDRFVRGFLMALYPDPDRAKSHTRAQNKRGDIWTTLRTQPGADTPSMRTADGQPTRYALLNAVAHYWQHDSTSRSAIVAGESSLDRTRRRSEDRMRQNMLGGSQELQRGRAVNLLLKADELERAGTDATALALVAN